MGLTYTEEFPGCLGVGICHDYMRVRADYYQLTFINDIYWYDWNSGRLWNDKTQHFMKYSIDSRGFVYWRLTLEPWSKAWCDAGHGSALRFDSSGLVLDTKPLVKRKCFTEREIRDWVDENYNVPSKWFNEREFYYE